MQNKKGTTAKVVKQGTVLKNFKGLILSGMEIISL